MDPQQIPGAALAELSARHNYLEQQVAELTRKISALEERLSGPVQAYAPGPVKAQSTAPPPPPLLAPVVNDPGVVPPQAPRASLEKRLGSQVFNRIGIVALLIGATWFLKLAVDNQWIGATGRVLIGLLAGAAIVLWSERFRHSGFPAFSYSLKAIGTGVLYLTLWASFQLYHLLPGAGALAAMLLVTAWNAYMAWVQDAELLAAYALAGGLSTPLLLSTGGNHEIFLFTYLLAIDLACVVLTRLKPWPRLLAAAFPATVAYFIGWYASFYQPSELGVTSSFVLLFFAVFAVAVFGARADRETPSHRLISHLLLPIANAAFVSLALYSVLQDAGYHDLLPWLMVALSAVYLGLMRLPQPRITAALHLSLAIVFLTIAIPLKASGAWITIGWLVEGVALLLVSSRFADEETSSLEQPGRVLRILASAALLLGFGGIITELFFQGIFTRPAFFNRGLGTAITGLASFALAVLIAHRRATQEDRRWPSYLQIAAASFIIFNLTAILTGIVQIDLLGFKAEQGSDAALQRALAVSAFLMLYGALLLAAGFWQRSAFIRWQALILLVISIAKTFLYDMRNLSQGYRVLSFLGLGALLMAISFAYQKDWLSLRESASAAHEEASE